VKVNNNDPSVLVLQLASIIRETYPQAVLLQQLLQTVRSGFGAQSMAQALLGPPVLQDVHVDKLEASYIAVQHSSPYAHGGFGDHVDHISHLSEGNRGVVRGLVGGLKTLSHVE
jgi:hypothetical protein